jgi:DNA-binding response OmpR family regulator
LAKILIVDDEPDILLLLRLNLNAEGHEVVMAADGEKALARIADDHPELVVLDVMMPVLDGWGVLEALRAVEGAPPVIVVSAKTAGRDIAHAITLGACDYLTKPFDQSDLNRAIVGCLGRTGPERESHRQRVLAAVTEPGA